MSPTAAPGLPLRGDRITLRDWRPADVDALVPWLRDDAEWKKYDAPYYPLGGAAEVAQIVADRRSFAEATELPTPRTSLVVADAADDTFLGSTVWYWESQATDWRRLGMVLYDPSVWRGGRGTEALRLWTDYLFATTQVRRLDYITWGGNDGMLRVGAKLGFREEGRFRQARVVDGRSYDSVVMGVLRAEWEAGNPDGVTRPAR